MNPIQIVRLAIFAALMVAPLHAEEEVCTDYIDIAFNAMLRGWTEVGPKCGENMTLLYEYYRPQTMALCVKPGCVEEIKKAAKIVPSCVYSMSKTNLKTMVLAVAKTCENEAKEGNLPATGSGSLGSNDTANDGDLRYCTQGELDEIEKLRDSKEREKACGKRGANYANVKDSALCSRPECMAFYKVTLLKKMPDCYDKAAVKRSIAVCDALPETAPSPSVRTVSRRTLIVAVALTIYIVA